MNGIRCLSSLLAYRNTLAKCHLELVIPAKAGIHYKMAAATGGFLSFNIRLKYYGISEFQLLNNFDRSFQVLLGVSSGYKVGLEL